MGENCKIDEKEEYRVALTEEEVDNFRLIDIKMLNANQALDLRNIPVDTPLENSIAFFVAAFTAKAEAEFLRQSWWQDALSSKILQGKHVHIDILKKELVVYKD